MTKDASSAKSHDNHAVLTELYESYEVRLRNYGLSLTNDPDSADDLVQETFLRAYAHLRKLALLKPHQQRSWLYRTLKNLFIDGYRAGKREQKLVDDLGWEFSLERPSMQIVRSVDLVRELPVHYQEVIYRRYYLGMNSQEIGLELGIPPATVRSRLHLALKRLRAIQKSIDIERM